MKENDKSDRSFLKLWFIYETWKATARATHIVEAFSMFHILSLFSVILITHNFKLRFVFLFLSLAREKECEIYFSVSEMCYARRHICVSLSEIYKHVEFYGEYHMVATENKENYYGY